MSDILDDDGMHVRDGLWLDIALLRPRQDSCLSWLLYELIVSSFIIFLYKHRWLLYRTL